MPACFMPEKAWGLGGRQFLLPPVSIASGVPKLCATRIEAAAFGKSEEGRHTIVKTKKKRPSIQSLEQVSLRIRTCITNATRH